MSFGRHLSFICTGLPRLSVPWFAHRVRFSGKPPRYTQHLRQEIRVPEPCEHPGPILCFLKQPQRDFHQVLANRIVMLNFRVNEYEHIPTIDSDRVVHAGPLLDSRKLSAVMPFAVQSPVVPRGTSSAASVTLQPIGLPILGLSSSHGRRLDRQRPELLSARCVISQSPERLAGNPDIQDAIPITPQGVPNELWLFVGSHAGFIFEVMCHQPQSPRYVLSSPLVNALRSAAALSASPWDS